MSKNLPARERPARRVHGKYAAKGKSSYKYPGWVTERRPPPPSIQTELEMWRWVAAGRYPAQRSQNGG